MKLSSSGSADRAQSRLFSVQDRTAGACEEDVFYNNGSVIVEQDSAGRVGADVLAP